MVASSSITLCACQVCSMRDGIMMYITSMASLKQLSQACEYTELMLVKMYKNIYMRSPHTELNKTVLLWTVRMIHIQ
jgi:hypothetical protein